jgi:hypothetical protein
MVQSLGDLMAKKAGMQAQRKKEDIRSLEGNKRR